MKKKIILCLAILLQVVIFLTANGIQKNKLSQENEKAIRNLHDAFEKSLIALDWEVLIEFYAEDAVQMPPNEPVVVGKESIQARFGNLKGISWEHRERHIKIIDGRDDLVFVWSTFKQSGEFNGSPFNNSGEMLQVYRKQSEGSWKIVCDVWSYDKQNELDLAPIVNTGVVQSNILPRFMGVSIRLDC